MKWNDLLYFSKGERNALSVLLFLTIIAWIILMLTDNTLTPLPPEEKIRPVTEHIMSDKPDSIQKPATVIASSSSSLKGTFTIKNPKRHSQQNNLRSSYTRTGKYPAGTVIELNAADTTSLKKIPGIATVFSNRIVKFRDLLGGFYCVSQLNEVYGIDKDKYEGLKTWFTVNPELTKKLNVNILPSDSLRKHPYINYEQARAIIQQRKQKRKLNGWEDLSNLEEFTETDKERLKYYLSFD